MNSMQRRLEKLESGNHGSQSVIVVVPAGSCDAELWQHAEQHGIAWPNRPLFVVTGVPRSPGDPLVSS